MFKRVCPAEQIPIAIPTRNAGDCPKPPTMRPDQFRETTVMFFQELDALFRRFPLVLGAFTVAHVIDNPDIGLIFGTSTAFKGPVTREVLELVQSGMATHYHNLTPRN